MIPEYKRRGITALVFDFDGTLARSTLDFSVMRREAVAAMQQHVDVPRRPDLPTMELLGLIGTETEPARAARKAALKAVRDVEVGAARTSALFPFVRPMLARLKELGIAMGIVTRNCPEALALVFPDAADHCVVLTRDDVPHVKPDPDHLVRALERLEVLPEHAIMVGDHPMDITVGKRAGTLTAGVASGDHGLEELAACAPDYAEKNGAELMRRLGIA